jgi:SAM-dependent methyltransferase
MTGDTATTGWDPVWERIFSSREWGKYPPEHVVRFVGRNFYRLPKRREVRLLEIGCGPGANVWFMAREGFAVSGIDGSRTAIRLADERLATEGLSAELRVGDYTTLPWPDASFDGVVENVSLYCNRWVIIQRALREIYRVLKPGAPFLSSFFTDRTWGYGLGTAIEPAGFVDIPEGPIAGTGFCLFLNRARLNELYCDFADIAVERVSWTMENERHLIEQFVINCRKPHGEHSY